MAPAAGLLLACFALAAPLQLHQDEPGVFAEPGGTAELHCSFRERLESGRAVRWYLRRDGGPPALLLRCDAHGGEPRHQCKHQHHRSSLRIRGARTTDSGVYYCAYIVASWLVFSDGCSLVVGGRPRGGGGLRGALQRVRPRRAPQRPAPRSRLPAQRRALRAGGRRRPAAALGHAQHHGRAATVAAGDSLPQRGLLLRSAGAAGHTRVRAAGLHRRRRPPALSPLAAAAWPRAALCSGGGGAAETSPPAPGCKSAAWGWGAAFSPALPKRKK
ncbi:uncharacterized protein [Struthio camelus]|uniref:uncharacterized protein isoform X1 n=1 Tax=Struthio camelus TaxID=8801 RepID=UPI003603CA40